MNNKYKLIVFDWDGTLMDSEAQIVACMKLAIEDLQLEYRGSDAIKNIIGLGLYEACSTLYPESTLDLSQQLTERYRYHFLSDGVLPAALFAGARKLLHSLEQTGHFLAVATGKGRSGLERSLKETGTGHLFHATRCADESRSKPHPEMLQDIMAYLGIESGHTLMIGDTEYDIQMAHNAGASAVAVSYGVHDKRRLMSEQPLACVDSIEELGQWFNLAHNLSGD